MSVCGWLVKCHVAQSRAATWHPVIGLMVFIKLGKGGRTRDLPLGRALAGLG
jgi:hypothetical protein